MPLARSLRAFCALLFVTATVYAQSTRSPYTLSANARLVITDVSVTDSKGAPVRGLKQADFQIAEDGKPQVIQAFDEQQQRTTSLPMDASVPQGVYSNIALGDLPKTTNVLLIDSFNSDVIDQMYLRIQLRRTTRARI